MTTKRCLRETIERIQKETNDLRDQLLGYSRSNKRLVRINKSLTEENRKYKYLLNSAAEIQPKHAREYRED